MGIQGKKPSRSSLLPLLKSIQKPTHLRNFAGQTLGIDAYGWLHRGTVACAIELAQQKPTRKHIEFALSRVRMLIHFGVKPFLIFDGDYLPSKSHTERDRATRRKESKRAGLELLRMGRVSQAHLELQKAVDVSPLMARELIEELKRLDVPYIVAPYEADSQLAYLEKQGIISGILSEDSDLLVFGAQCLLTKLDQYGECIMINRADFTACREISLVGWADKEFRMMAMLSGCDYLPGIEKMGLKTAYRLVRKHKAVDRVVRTVQFDGKMKVPPGYLEAFTRAEQTFLYQWVFCPEAQALVNLNAIPAELDAEDMPYIGHSVEPQIAAGVAVGDLDPNTKQRLVLPARQPQQPLSRTRSAQTPDDKQGKTIAEFFKARRTPLAELDPNSFTPSPSQQRLLESQRTTSWSASQIQTAPISAIGRLSPAIPPPSAPQPLRRTVTAPTALGPRASPKRQRLCSERLLGSPEKHATGSQAATSRFFSKQAVQPSPSLRKVSGQRKQDNFEIWTDLKTTISPPAELEAKMPITTTPSPKKRKKVVVYSDAPRDTIELNKQTADHRSLETEPERVPGHNSLLTTSRPPDEVALPYNVFSKGINTAFADLRSKWELKPEAQPRPSARAAAPPLYDMQPNAILGRALTSSSTSLRKIQVVANPTVVETLVAGSSPILGPSAVDIDNAEDVEHWSMLQERARTPDHVLNAKGSEDFLVPNSPARSEVDEAHVRPKLNLGHFAFAG
ncbi:Rad2 nuclease [Recurvomyces mirabilis]|uniref:Rad2 nuclease n=1 Tax=Recurvomyces mirabilis TaxID=574656 RepID=A0AAE1C495_9PEZI|nr:Rad2 nuclease [Recurvomyces mirabilis]KAK5159348.1 Rad2 nuclease [Recurvomyces mirabilis]